MKFIFHFFAMAIILLLPNTSRLYAHGHGGHCHASGHHGGGHSHGGFHGGYHGGFHSHRWGNGGGNPDIYELPLQGVSELTAGIATPDILIHNLNTMQLMQPNYIFGYKYHINNWLALNINVATGRAHGIDTCTCNAMAEPRPYNYTLTSFRTTIGATWLYTSSGLCQLYGGLSLGLNFYREDDEYSDHTRESFHDTKFTGHLTLLGFRFGRKLGVFGEVGLGCQGILSAGISYQPNWRLG